MGTVALKCFPVCECGEIIKNLHSYTSLEKVNENYHREVRHFEPSECPKCKKSIKSIEMIQPTYGGVISFRK